VKRQVQRIILLATTVGWVLGGTSSMAQPINTANQSSPAAISIHATPKAPRANPPSQRLSYIPPRLKVPANRGLKGQRIVELGARSICPDKPALVALIPNHQPALSTEAFPTFWFYVPYTLPEEVLQLELSTGEHVIYSDKFVAPSSPGIVGLQLPKTAQPLRLNTLYRWRLTVLCDSTQGPWVFGYILREKKPKRITAATAMEQAVQFAKAGFWFDTLTLLGERLQQKEDDLQARTFWRELLSAKAVDLYAWADFPILSCCGLK
jgi:hypothetical protein